MKAEPTLENLTERIESLERWLKKERLLDDTNNQAIREPMNDAKITKEDRDLEQEIQNNGIYRTTVHTSIAQLVANHRAKCAGTTEQEKLAQEFRDNHPKPFHVAKSMGNELLLYDGGGLPMSGCDYWIEQLAAYLNQQDDLKMVGKKDD